MSLHAETDTRATARSLFRKALFARADLFFQAAAAGLLANLLALGTSLYSMQVYDRVIPTQGISTLLVLTVGVMIAMVLELVVKLVRARVLEGVIKGMDLEISFALFARLLRVRLDQYPAQVGTLSAQVKSYEQIRNFLSSATLYLLVDAPFALLFALVIASIAGLDMAAIPVAFFFLAVAVGLFHKGRIAKHAQSGFAANNQKLGLLVETVEAAETIKASGMAARQFARWRALSLQGVDDDLAIRHHSESASYWAAWIQQVSYALLVGTGAWVAATTNGLTTGGLIACSILSGRVLAPVAAVPGLLVQWAHAKSAMASLDKLFTLACDNEEVSHPLEPEAIQGVFRTQNLKFVYPGRPQAFAVRDTLIRSGERVGILGPVGVGKSTLLKLLAGLYAPKEGQVLLDGLDIQQIDRPLLSRSVGYLQQETKLVSGTLRTNLDPNGMLRESLLLRTARVTGLDALILSHPKGLDMPIGEGGQGVSGGQRQLIALTRLLLAKPSAWLLDEPTAAMDELSEGRALAALRQSIGPEQTLILVTHKPALLAIVDRLIVLLPDGRALDGPKQAVLAALQPQPNTPRPTPANEPTRTQAAHADPLLRTAAHG